jgi:FAD/FMN-containing dehydrogenase
MSAKIGPNDPRFADRVRRGFNKRFTAKPDYVHLVTSKAEVIAALQDAVDDNLRVVVRSGGHCLEGFVADPAVRVIIDISLMTGVDYDADMGAFVVAAGTTVGELYRRLFLGFGVLVPAGESPDVGAGGHILGGAFGFLCREHGLAADHLYAIELVYVDESGRAQSVVATRELSDPNRELWWAHTGGGGGNFGIVTRYWFRSTDVTHTAGADPASLLPKAPDSILIDRVTWKWEDVDEAAFTTLLRNFGTWCEQHSDARSPNAKLYTLLLLKRRELGTLEMKGVSTAGVDAERLFKAQLAAVTAGVAAPHTQSFERSSWLKLALDPLPELFGVGMDDARTKIKDAFLRKRFTERQIATVWRYLTRTEGAVLGGVMGLATYGGQVNALPPDATASAQRDSILSTSCSVGWGDPKDEARSIAWVRAFYVELFADTGGVPAPSERCDGAMINHPDADLADPALNTSGVPWHTLYYNDNYARLQRVKARWDPRNVFHHALSIRA